MSLPVTLEIPDRVLRFIQSHGSFLVLGHMEPDADCVGGQLALSIALRTMGKSAIPANPGPFDRVEIAEYAERFTTYLDPSEVAGDTAAIIVDCSSPDRIGAFQDAIDGLPSLVIDHHVSGDQFGDVRLVEPRVPAATILVTELLRALEIEWTREIADLLFLGLATDTGFFRFLDSEQTIAFETAAFLSGHGAAPREIARRIESGRHFDSRVLISRMLARAERCADGQVIITYQTRADEREFGSRRDSDALYRLLTSVEGVRVIAVAKEKQEGCAISFRSTDETDVSAIARELGGGGHRNASGALMKTPLLDCLAHLRTRLTAAVRKPR